MSDIDWEAYEAEAAGAIAAAATTGELEDVRVALPRPQERARAGAARGARPRDRHAAERHPRSGSRRPSTTRERALADEELDRRLREEVIDVTLPGEELPLGHLHPITQVRRTVEDAFLGLGYEVRDDREVETVEYNFDKLAFLPTHSARSPRDTFFFDDDARAAHGDEPVADPHHGGEAAADLHGLDRPRLPPRRDHGDALPDLPPVRGARRRPRA